MPGYTKLFSRILDSTIWREDDKTRILWITMLAMANKDGVVESTIPGLADRARISLEECEAALERFQQPDKYSWSKEKEGRRLEVVEGGWFLINHAKYRELLSKEDQREKTRLRVAKFRALRNDSVTQSNDRNDKHLHLQKHIQKQEPKPPDQDFSVDSATSHCLIEAALAGNKIRSVVREVIQREASSVGVDLKTIAETMAESWRNYDLLQIPFKKNPESFFGSGTWRKDQGEWKSNKKESVSERNKRAFAEVERRSQQDVPAVRSDT